MIDLDSIVTGRQLVAAISELGVGRWGADSVRQWIREEPACPIAERGDQGKPNRYQLRAVLEWLRLRALGERAKSHRRGDGPDLLDRVDAVLSGNTLNATIPLPVGDESQKIAPPVSHHSGGGGVQAVVSPNEGFQQSAPPASIRDQVDWLAMSEADTLRAVLQGRDPRNWKASEEADALRRDRLIAERRLIPIEELELALDLHTQHTRKNIISFAQSLKAAVRDFVAPEHRHAAEQAIELQIDLLLEQLAKTDDIDSAQLPVTPTNTSDQGSTD